MSSIDSRIVEMKFENSRFERGVAATIGTLDKLKKALSFGGSSKGLDELNGAVKKASFGDMAKGIDNISSKFSVLGAIGFTVIQRLTNGVIDFGKKMASKAISNIWDPIFTGGKDRAVKIEQAKFQFRGLGQDVDKSMESALEAVKGTAYGLDAAAAVAAQFGASGMEAGDDMTGALRGVAGMAAMSGRSYEEIGQIFTTIAGEGKLSTMRLQQFSTRGVNAAAKMADMMGISEGAVRKLVSQGKISFQDFAGMMDKAFGKHATKANETYTGALANMNAALSRIGASFQIHKLEAMRKVMNALTPVIDDVHEALQPLIKVFGEIVDQGAKNMVNFLKKLDMSNLKVAMPPFADGIKNIYDAAMRFVKPIKQAFRDIFPKSAGNGLKTFAEGFKKFTESLKIGEKTAHNVRRTFRGVFAIFSIGWQVIKGVVGVFADLLGMAFGGRDFWNFTGGIGDFFVRIDKNLKQGKGLTNFFSGLSGFIGKAAGAIKNAVIAIKDFVTGFGLLEGAKNLLVGFWNLVKKVFGGFGQALADTFNSGSFDKILDILKTVFLGGILLLLKKFYQSGFFNLDLGGSMVESIKGTFDQLTASMEALQTQIQAKTLMTIAAAIGLLTLSVVALSMIDAKKLAKALTALTVGFAQLLAAMAILVKISGTAGFIKVPMIAGAMVLLAGSILILSAAVKVLSTMNWTELAKGLTGVGALLAMLAIAVIPLSKGSGGMVRVGIGLTGIAIAMNLLALAVKQFSGLSWSEMGKGLAGVGASLAILAGAVRLFPKGMLVTAAGLVAIGVAMNLLAAAMKIFGSMDVVSMVTGLSGMGGALLAIGLALRVFPKNMLVMGAGLLAVSVGMNLIAIALKTFGGMTWMEIAKGLVAMGASLLILGVGLKFMSGTLLGSAALLIAAAALAVLAPALAALGMLSWGTIVKGLITLAAAMTILGVAGYLINVATFAIIGLAASLLMIGGAFLLAGTGALAFATAFTMIVATGSAGVLVLQQMLSTIISLIPAALKAFAVGLIDFVVKIGEGAPKIATAFGKVMIAIINTIIEAMPRIGAMINAMMSMILDVISRNVPKMIAVGMKIMIAFLQGISNNISRLTILAITIIVRFNNALASRMPMLIASGVRVIVSFLNGVARNMPKLVTAGVNVIVRFLQGLAQNMPRLVAAGINVIVKLLNGIAQNMGKLVAAGVRVIVSFLNGIARNIGRIITAGANIVVQFLKGIGRNASRIVTAGAKAVTDFLKGVGRNVNKVVSAGGKIITDFLKGLGRNISKIIRAGTDMIVKILNALTKGMPRIIKAGSDAIQAFLKGLERELPKITNQAAKTLIAFINGLADAINKNQQKLNKASQRLAKAIIDGMVWGLKWNAGKVGKAALKVAKDSLNGAMNWLGVNSPSKRWRDEVGKPISEGMAVGIEDDGYRVTRASIDVAEEAMDKTKTTLSKLGSSLGGDLDMTPVIAPVLDLSHIRKDAGLIDGMISAKPVTAETSYSGATAIAQQQRIAAETTPEAKIAEVQRKIEFNQYNTSPKALSDIEIYRQTKNQLAAAKGAIS